MMKEVVNGVMWVGDGKVRLKGVDRIIDCNIEDITAIGINPTDDGKCIFGIGVVVSNCDFVWRTFICDNEIGLEMFNVLVDILAFKRGDDNDD